MKRKETEYGEIVGVKATLQREKLNGESVKKIGGNETEQIFGWVKKIIENISRKIKEQNEENDFYNKNRKIIRINQ